MSQACSETGLPRSVYLKTKKKTKINVWLSVLHRWGANCCDRQVSIDFLIWLHLSLVFELSEFWVQVLTLLYSGHVGFVWLFFSFLFLLTLASFISGSQVAGLQQDRGHSGRRLGVLQEKPQQIVSSANIVFFLRLLSVYLLVSCILVCDVKWVAGRSFCPGSIGWRFVVESPQRWFVCALF